MDAQALVLLVGAVIVAFGAFAAIGLRRPSNRAK
jgi:hypothetical protein